MFSVLAPWWPNEESDWTEIWSVSYSYLAPWWPNQESDWTEIWSVSYSYLVVHMYKVSGQQLQRLQNVPC
jgi:hypothetical protein